MIEIVVFSDLILHVVCCYYREIQLNFHIDLVFCNLAKLTFTIFHRFDVFGYSVYPIIYAD